MTPFEYSDRDGDKLKIEPSHVRSETAHVLVNDQAVYVLQDDAPAAARALLEAAGAHDYAVVRSEPATAAEDVDEGPQTNEPQPRYGVMIDPLPEGAPLMPSFVRTRPAKLVATWPDRQDVVELASGRCGPLLAISARLNGEPLPEGAQA